MNYSLKCDTKSFSKDPEGTKLKEILSPLLSQTISSTDEYNHVVKTLVHKLQNFPLKKPATPLFTKEVKGISIRSPLVEQTPWGGVSIKKVDTVKDFIQKLLIIQQHGILGFEYHKKKQEKLFVCEGLCLFLHVTKKDPKTIFISFAKPHTKAIFHPGDSHGILAMTNTVIQETSTNHLDDLEYIFPAAQFNS